MIAIPRRTVGVTVALVLAAAPPALAQLTADIYVSGLQQPVGFVQDPSDVTVQFVVEQPGRVRAIRHASLQPDVVLDVSSQISSGGERGLLGIALPPDFGSSRRMFVTFTNPDGHFVVSRFRVPAALPLRADVATRLDLQFDEPMGARYVAHPFFTNHNGGHLAFGPDGYLYIAMGDGGGGDPNNRAQNPMSLAGKMLRIDVSVADGHSRGYAIPADNPFVDGLPVMAREEIWSFGFRNPWKFSFDMPSLGGTGALIVADVGQSAREEINYEPAGVGGRNYGWKRWEGSLSYDGSIVLPYGSNHVPTFEYSHAEGLSITGGAVYRGQALGAAFGGRYFFADFVRGRTWSLALAIDPSTHEATAFDLQEHTAALGSMNVSAFGVDATGELYVLSYAEGTIRRLRRADSNRLLLGLSAFPGEGGWLSVRTGVNARLDLRDEIGVPWASVKSGGGGSRPAVGDIDGDGRDEIVVGFSSGFGGWIAIFDDAATDYRFLRWLQVSWPAYNNANGEVWPAVGDFDGDGRAEIAAGLGSGGQGWVQIFDDAAAGFGHMRWIQIDWPGYSANGHEIRPVALDVDGDGVSELLFGLNTHGSGWMQLRSSAALGFRHRQWLRVMWPEYNAANGETRPAGGDLDGDGFADLVAGLGAGGGGWMEVFRGSPTGLTHSRWVQISWAAYATAVGATYPAIGNLDSDADLEIAVGLNQFGMDGGWFTVHDDQRHGHVPLQWRQLEWTPFVSSGRGVIPVVFRN